MLHVGPTAALFHLIRTTPAMHVADEYDTFDQVNNHHMHEEKQGDRLQDGTMRHAVDEVHLARTKPIAQQGHRQVGNQHERA